MEFRWFSAWRSVPGQWDLRRAGWRRLSRLEPIANDRAEVVLLDGLRTLDAVGRSGGNIRFELHGAIVLGARGSAERARLIEQGLGDALPIQTGLPELTLRAQLLRDRLLALPRRQTVGRLVLDLLHRDARLGDCWLALHPREFAVLWRLAESGGRPVSRTTLLRDVWRLIHEPETNSVAVHVSRLRAKLGAAGLRGLVATDPDGSYYLALETPLISAALDCARAVDHYGN